MPQIYTIRRALLESASLSTPAAPPGRSRGQKKHRLSGSVPLSSIEGSALDRAMGDAVTACEAAHEGTGLKPAFCFHHRRRDDVLMFNASTFIAPALFDAQKRAIEGVHADIAMAAPGDTHAHVLVEVRWTEPDLAARRAGGVFLELRGVMFAAA